MHLRTTPLATRTAARAAFTLMELLVVVAILLVLIAVVTPTYFKYVDESRVKVARSDAVRLAGELKQYYVSRGQYPEGMPSFDMLLAEGLLEREALDPWGLPYQWTLRPVGLDGMSFVPFVWSCGPNKADEQGGGDDIANQ